MSLQLCSLSITCEDAQVVYTVVVAYLGEEGALAVGELNFSDIEELELPLDGRQLVHSP